MYRGKPYDDSEAVVEFHDGEMRIVRPGLYVKCAVSGERIPVNDVRYWSVDRQEAYASPREVLIALGYEMKGA
ncbi:MAG: DUF2093 domain-containing protein [Methylobacteriaceae bacterium]|nr:DUF2093 domain-containing protein [Methylobacteriaceae bacterium]